MLVSQDCPVTSYCADDPFSEPICLYKIQIGSHRIAACLPSPSESGRPRTDDFGLGRRRANLMHVCQLLCSRPCRAVLAAGRKTIFTVFVASTSEYLETVPINVTYQCLEFSWVAASDLTSSSRINSGLISTLGGGLSILSRPL